VIDCLNSHQQTHTSARAQPGKVLDYMALFAIAELASGGLSPQIPVEVGHRLVGLFPGK